LVDYIGLIDSLNWPEWGLFHITPIHFTRSVQSTRTRSYKSMFSFNPNLQLQRKVKVLLKWKWSV